MSLLKKKIMLVVCYLLLIVGMLMTITWARYKKDINGDILVAEAADFRASLNLKDTEESLVIHLTDLRPGETAEDNFNAARHGVTFDINNVVSENTSDKPIGYTLRVYGKGHIPLSMVLYDVETNKTYTASKSAVGDGDLYTFNDINENVLQKEHEFCLKGIENDSNRFVLYVGWQTSGENEDFDDRKYMKEVELLEIRAVVRAIGTGLDTPTVAPEVKKPSNAEQ